MTKGNMIEWFKSAPMSSRHERMLWAAHKIAGLTRDHRRWRLSDAVDYPD